MATDVLMPQMGESIAEGTIVRWIKKPGDAVDRDEPLFEISTDKVDAEIPSPAAGVLLEIKVKEGETVPVNSVVALIGEAGERTGTEGTEGSTGSTGSEGSTGSVPQVQGSQVPQVQAETAAATTPAAPAEATVEDLRRTKSSPVVRKIAAEHGVDISQLQGSGISGRVTKKDILAYVESGAGKQAAPASASAAGASAAPAGRP